MDDRTPGSSQHLYATHHMPWDGSEADPLAAVVETLAGLPPAAQADFWWSFRAALAAHPDFDDDSGREAVARRREALQASRCQPRGPSVVYYLRFRDRVKIGTTANLPARLLAIPHDELLATEPGDRDLEGARHAQFAALRDHGEWFRYDSPLREHIAALA